MSNLANFVWSIADQLRGVYKPKKYGNVILPLTILRRMECVLEPHRELISGLAETTPPDVLELVVRDQTGLTFYNTSPHSLARILEEPENLRNNLRSYLEGFLGNVVNPDWAEPAEQTWARCPALQTQRRRWRDRAYRHRLAGTPTRPYAPERSTPGSPPRTRTATTTRPAPPAATWTTSLTRYSPSPSAHEPSSRLHGRSRRARPISVVARTSTPPSPLRSPSTDVIPDR